MNPIVKHSLAFLVFAFFQIFLLNDLTLGQVATPHVFVLFLLMLPLNWPIPVLLLIAFGTGLFIDVFALSYGIHAFSCVLMMALREIWVRFITRSSFRTLDEIPLSNQTLLWYVFFLFPLIQLHHLAFYFLEAFGFHNFWYTLLKAFSSAIYTFVLSFLITIVFYKEK